MFAEPMSNSNSNEFYSNSKLNNTSIQKTKCRQHECHNQ
jgi:hypothetical protein